MSSENTNVPSSGAWLGLAGSVGSSLISTAGSLWSGHKNRQFARDMYQRQMQDTWALKYNDQAYQTSEREAAQEYSTDMWNLNNQYNSASAQMARMMQAGINPNNAAQMVNGSTSSAPSSSSGAAPGSSAPSGSVPLQENPFASLPDAALTAAQIGLISAERKGKEIDNQTKGRSNELSLQEREAVIENLKTDTNYKKWQAELTESQKKQIDELLPVVLAKDTEEINQICAATQLLYAQYQEALQAVEESKQRVAESQQNVEESKANTNLINLKAVEQGWRATMVSQGINIDAPVATRLFDLMTGENDNLNKVLNSLMENLQATVSKIATSAAESFKEAMKGFKISLF